MKTYRGRIEIKCAAKKCPFDLRNCKPSCAHCKYGKPAIIGLTDKVLLNLKTKHK